MLNDQARSGFDPTSHLTLVRNPNYNAKTDSPAMRENYVDGVDHRRRQQPE